MSDAMDAKTPADVPMDDARLHDLLDGRLDGDAASALQAEIASTPALRMAWEELQQIQRWVRSHAPHGAAAEAPPTLASGIRARIAALEAARARTPDAEAEPTQAEATQAGTRERRPSAQPRIVRYLTMAYAAAALVVVGFTLVYVVNMPGAGTPPPAHEHAGIETPSVDRLDYGGDTPSEGFRKQEAPKDELAKESGPASPNATRPQGTTPQGTSPEATRGRAPGGFSGPGDSVKPGIRTPSNEPRARAEGSELAAEKDARAPGSQASGFKKTGAPAPMADAPMDTPTEAAEQGDAKRGAPGSSGAKPGRLAKSDPSESKVGQAGSADAKQGRSQRNSGMGRSWGGRADELARLEARAQSGEVVYVLETDDPARARAALAALYDAGTDTGARSRGAGSIGLGGGGGGKISRPAADASSAGAATRPAFYRLDRVASAALRARLRPTPDSATASVPGAPVMRVHSTFSRPHDEQALARVRARFKQASLNLRSLDEDDGTDAEAEGTSPPSKSAPRRGWARRAVGAEEAKSAGGRPKNDGTPQTNSKESADAPKIAAKDRNTPAAPGSPTPAAGSPAPGGAAAEPAPAAPPRTMRPAEPAPAAAAGRGTDQRHKRKQAETGDKSSDGAPSGQPLAPPKRIRILIVERR